MAGLGDLEREVMTHLWESGEPLTVRQVHERLSRDRGRTADRLPAYP